MQISRAHASSSITVGYSSVGSGGSNNNNSTSSVSSNSAFLFFYETVYYIENRCKPPVLSQEEALANPSVSALAADMLERGWVTREEHKKLLLGDR